MQKPMQKRTEHTLAAAISCIPKSCYENPTWKGIAYAVRDAVIYAATIAALAATDSPLLVAPLWILSGLAISALFIVGHDAAHGSLFASSRLCYIVGQLCMLPSLHLYEMWVYGHNRIHHGHTTREVMDYVWHPSTPQEYAAMRPWQRLAHRIKWSWLGGGLYYLWDIWWTKMIRFTPPEKIVNEVRRDRWVVGTFAALATAALLGWGYSMYGTLTGAIWLWTKLLAVPFVVWNYSIGIAVYVHHIAQDIHWQTRREWEKFAAQMEGTTILHIPTFLNVFYHNIFLHVPHHVDMRIPFYGLPAATRALRESYGHVVRERRYRMRDYFTTTGRCKLFDFDKGVWCDYTGQSVEASPVPARFAAQG